jgi:hypothetical protein
MKPENDLNESLKKESQWMPGFKVSQLMAQDGIQFVARKRTK